LNQNFREDAANGAKNLEVAEKEGRKVIPSFQMLKKGFSVAKNNSIFSSPSLADERIKNFKHMKSILGHISVEDENIINTVAIYCVCFSKDNDLIFTGDNNGLIKIWSSRTGALVEIFNSHNDAINDILLHGNFLISCSDDSSVKIWDVEKLCLVKTINFGEPIISVICYEFLANITHKNSSNLSSANLNTSQNNNLVPVIICSSSDGKIFLFNLNTVIQKLSQKNSDPPTEYENETFISRIYFDKKIVEKFNLKKIKNNLKISCMTAHNKSGILVCGYNEGVICVWDIEKILHAIIINNKFVHEFERYILFLEYVHSSVIQISEFNKKGDYFITGSIDGCVLIWKVKEDVIKKMRTSNSSTLSESSETGIYPIFSIFRLTENENKTRCSVNAATWSSNNNYVIAMISSRNKKKTQGNSNLDQAAHLTPNLQPATQSSAIHNNHSVNNESPNISNVYKRSSSILVYDINQNKMIRRYDSENGFNIHDECYVLESHPINEEVILTVSNCNEIILFNFLTGQILCKFKEENYFFNNVTQSIVASEGKFSQNGDSFVISTYFGSISIYNIYSRASFSGTYMNQFFKEEFEPKPEDEDRVSHVKDITETAFTNYVNMHSLPYIYQQPYTKFKLNQLEQNVFSVLMKKYNYSMKEITHKLMNNYECYEKNLEERQFECEREEQIFIQAAKENLTYMIPEGGLELEESEEAYSEFNLETENFELNAEVENDDEIMENLEREENDIQSMDNFLDDESEGRNRRRRSRNNNFSSRLGNMSANRNNRRRIRTRARNNSGNSEDGHYNLRRRNVRNRTDSSNNEVARSGATDRRLRYSRRHGEDATDANNILNNSYNNLNSNNSNENSGSRRTRNQRQINFSSDQPIVAFDMEDEKQYNDIEDLNYDENYYDSKKIQNFNENKRDKKRLRSGMLIDDEDYENENKKSSSNKRRKKSNNYDESENDFSVKSDKESESDFDAYDDNSQNLQKSKNKKMLSDSDYARELEIEEMYKNHPIYEKVKKFGKEIVNIVNKCRGKEATCYLCKFESSNSSPAFNNSPLIGPFYTYNNLDFELDKNRLDSAETKNNMIIDEEEEERIKNSSELNTVYIHIECLLLNNDFLIYDKVLSHFKINLLKTLKEVVSKNIICYRCDSPFATKKCSEPTCDKFFHGHFCLSKYCIETPVNENKFTCLECVRILNKDNKDTTQAISYKHVSRDYFNKSQYSFYVFYPQVKDKVYFILKAYEDFLRNFYDSIIMEFDENQKIFFWKDEGSFSHESYAKPLLCEILKVEFSFPNNNTLNLLKKIHKNKSIWQERLNIIIKLQIKITSLDNKVMDIIFFKNDLPDYLISSENFDKNYKLYENLISTINQRENPLIYAVIDETNFDANFMKKIDRENNQLYKDSMFENMLIKYLVSDDKDYQMISFWDMYNSELEVNLTREDNLINLCKFLNAKIEELYKKNEGKYVFFKKMVDEDLDKAEGYYNFIAAPMYLDLILERLNKNFYVSVESIENDLDVLQNNASTFNGRTSDIAKWSRELVKEIKNLISQYIKGSFNSSEKGKKFGRKYKGLEAPNNDLNEVTPSNSSAKRSQRVTRSSTNLNNLYPTQRKINYNENVNNDFELDLNYIEEDENKPLHILKDNKEIPKLNGNSLKDRIHSDNEEILSKDLNTKDTNQQENHLKRKRERVNYNENAITNNHVITKGNKIQIKY
jgi:WD40 repeat protein